MTNERLTEGVVVFGASATMLAMRDACLAAGLPLPPAGRVAPGRKMVLLVDVEAFVGLCRSYGRLILAAASEWFFVVGEPGTSDERLAEIAMADGTFVSSGTPEMLPMLLRRVLNPPAPPASAAVPVRIVRPSGPGAAGGGGAPEHEAGRRQPVLYYY